MGMPALLTIMYPQHLTLVRTWSPFEKDVMRESLTSMITAGRGHRATCLFCLRSELLPPQRPGHIHILISAVFIYLSMWAILGHHSSDSSTHEPMRVTAGAFGLRSSKVGPAVVHLSKCSRCPGPTLNGIASAPHHTPSSLPDQLDLRNVFSASRPLPLGPCIHLRSLLCQIPTSSRPKMVQV